MYFVLKYQRIGVTNAQIYLFVAFCNAYKGYNGELGTLSEGVSLPFFFFFFFFASFFNGANS